MYPTPGWNIDKAYNRGRSVLREQGPRALWFKVWGELGYRRLILFESQFGDTQRPPEPPHQPESGWLTKDRIGDLRRLHPATSEDLIRRRFEAGRRCWIGLIDGEIVYSSWAATGTAWAEYLGVGLRLDSDSHYPYSTFVHPAWRQTGLAQSLTWRRREILAAEGLSRTVCSLMPENHAGERLIRALGYREFGTLRRWRVGGVQFSRLNTNVAGVRIEEIPPDLRC